MPCKQKKKKVLSLFTVPCISYWHAGLGIVQSLVSSFGESLDMGLYFAPQLPHGFDHFYGAGRGGEPRLPRGTGRPSLIGIMLLSHSVSKFRRSCCLVASEKLMIVEACDVLCHFPGELRWGGQWLVSGKKEEQEQEDSTFHPSRLYSLIQAFFRQVFSYISGLDLYFCRTYSSVERI